MFRYRIISEATEMFYPFDRFHDGVWNRHYTPVVSKDDMILPLR